MDTSQFQVSSAYISVGGWKGTRSDRNTEFFHLSRCLVSAADAFNLACRYLSEAQKVFRRSMCNDYHQLEKPISEAKSVLKGLGIEWSWLLTDSDHCIDNWRQNLMCKGGRLADHVALGQR